MHIELLWLIPIFAFAGFLFLVAFYAQRKDEMRSRDVDLSKEVDLFNSGRRIQGKQVTKQDQDARLRELEKAINVIATSLSQQQAESRVESGSGTAAAGRVNEVDELKEKLRTVFKEYDIILSENYSLRAKVKQMMKKAELMGDTRAVDDTRVIDDPRTATVDSFLTKGDSGAKPALHLYGDTRIMKVIEDDPERDASTGSALR